MQISDILIKLILTKALTSKIRKKTSKQSQRICFGVHITSLNIS